MSTKRTYTVKKPLKFVANCNALSNTSAIDPWDVRNRNNLTDDFYYPNSYSSMKLDFHRSQFDFNKNDHHNHHQRPLTNVYSSATIVCGNENNGDEKNLNFNSSSKKAELFSNNASIASLYRSTPLLNYSANSYFGWHHNRTASGTLPIQSSNKPTVSELNKFYTIEKGTTFANHHHNHNNNHDLLNMQGSLSSSVRSTATSQFGSSLINIRKNRVKICIVVAILTIMVAVLVAMGVAVYSQVNNEANGVKVVRQYQGSFTVTNDGPDASFDREALNKDSDAFKKIAAIFAKKIDSIFSDSGLGRLYEGTEILSFRFPVAPSKMEVHFVLKTKVDVVLKVQDILALFENGVQKNIGGIFNDLSIDIDSIKIENEKFERKSFKQSTKVPVDIS